MKRLIYTYVFIAVLLGVLIAAILSYKNISPFKKITQYIFNLGIDYNKKDSVYDYIINSMKELNMSKNEFLSQLDSMRNLARHNSFGMLLSGNMYGYSKLEENQRCFISSERNRIVLVNVNKYDAKPDEAEILLVKTIYTIKNNVPPEGIIYTCNFNEIVVLLPVESTEFDDLQALKKTMNKLLNELTSLDELQVRITVSEEFSGIEDVYGAYTQCKYKAVSYNAEFNDVIFLESNQYDNTRGYIDLLTLSKLDEHIWAGNKEEIGKLLRDVFLGDQSRLSMEDVEQIFFSIRGILVSNAAKNCNFTDVVIPDFDLKKSRKELCKSLEQSFYSICDKISGERKSNNVKLKEGILEYINTNYDDTQMCVTSIAEHFNISKKYLPNFIKEQTGKTYLGYIEEIRLKKSLELIKSTDISIAQVAQMCGFSSQNTFYKAFKRFYNVSPTTYREK